MSKCCPYHGENRRPAVCPDCFRLRHVPQHAPRTSIPRSIIDQGKLRIRVLSGEEGRLDKVMFVKIQGDQTL